VVAEGKLATWIDVLRGKKRVIFYFQKLSKLVELRMAYA